MHFRTKARAVDLLGKGQIADLPTAITELWKNGFDAYADKLTAEIYLTSYKDTKTPILLITDDGKGMSRTDILEKWLVLGTDSKSRADSDDTEGPETLWKKPRIKAGEKGIGRLSVAYLGSPMLMLTKKRGAQLQALYFDWRLLENYNMFLDDVQLPVIDVNKNDDFNKLFDSLKANFLKNFDLEKDLNGNLIWEKKQLDLKHDIIAATEELKLPSYFELEILKDLRNVKDDNGTKFIIFNPEQQILDLVNSDQDKKTENEFVRSSITAFINQFKIDPLPVDVKFPIHMKIGNDIDYLTSAGKFFTPEDFDLSDIVIDGTFDGQGNFAGEITMYNEDPIKYKHKGVRKKDVRANYGEFKLKLGYSMGKEKESKLDNDTWLKLRERIKNYGGLYIYRDGFRVLPYGRTEYDFLEFERKRALRAAEYFFSHRRMFGYIEISRKTNEGLRDKAGREGLINNAAFRAFKSDLQHFFDGLAKEYFSDKARKSLFLDLKKKKSEQHEEIEKDKKREKEAKIAFTKSLKSYPNRFEEYKNNYESAIYELSKKVAAVNLVYSEIEDLLDIINKLDLEYEDLLPKIPKRYEPTETQLKRLDKYESLLNDFNDNIKKGSKNLMKDVQQKLAVQELRKEFIKNYDLLRLELEGSMHRYKEQLNTKFTSISNEYINKSRRTIEDLDIEKGNVLNNIETKEDVIDGISKVKKKYEFLREQVNKKMLPLVEHVERLTFEIDEELLQGAYKAEYEKIKYQWEQTRETAQLGIAVEIIDHEFNILYSQINSSIAELDKEVSGTEPAHYTQLKKAFNQLEDKYELLSPLYRISGATPKKVSGESISEYLKKFFARKLEEDSIKVNTTSNFKKEIIEINEPVIHTVFINIINNAIYWLRNADKKEITLDYNPKNKEFIIMNSGASIEDRNLDRIFDLFYSNRPNGRGIGLFLARESLQENHFDIYATNAKEYNTLGGACFIIKRQSK